MGVEWKSGAVCVALCGWVFLGALGCRSTPEEWNPFVNLSAYEAVVVNDFSYPADPAVGRELANQVASELVRRQAFEEVRRSEDDREALVLTGEIETYDEGNVAARIKFGHGVGDARMVVAVRVMAAPAGQLAGTFRVEESTLLTGPDAGRTGRETVDWVQRQVAEKVAVELEERVTTRRGGG